MADFTGREVDLSWLLRQAEEIDSYASLVLAIDGMPGVGKTTLAVRAAHQLKPGFPDGQLSVDLHGYSENPPTDPSAALGALLGQLGVPAGQIPTDFDERVNRWRTELASRRVLVVLDNAANSAQVNPLLPPGESAVELHKRALDGYLRTKNRAGQARALDGMAACLRDTDPAAARRHWEQALEIFRELDHPDQHEVERRLAKLADEPEPRDGSVTVSAGSNTFGN